MSKSNTRLKTPDSNARLGYYTLPFFANIGELETTITLSRTRLNNDSRLIFLKITRSAYIIIGAYLQYVLYTMHSGIKLIPRSIQMRPFSSTLTPLAVATDINVSSSAFITFNCKCICSCLVMNEFYPIKTEITLTSLWNRGENHYDSYRKDSVLEIVKGIERNT